MTCECRSLHICEFICLYELIFQNAGKDKPFSRINSDWCFFVVRTGYDINLIFRLIEYQIKQIVAMI